MNFHRIRIFFFFSVSNQPALSAMPFRILTAKVFPNKRRRCSMKPLNSVYRKIERRDPKQYRKNHPGHGQARSPVLPQRLVNHADEKRRREVSKQVHGKNSHRNSLWPEHFID
jgi:hypothetical protein